MVSFDRVSKTEGDILLDVIKKIVEILLKLYFILQLKRKVLTWGTFLLSELKNMTLFLQKRYMKNLKIMVYQTADMSSSGNSMNICILKESLNIGGTERSAANISKIISKDHNVWVALYDASHIQYTYGGTIIDFRLPPRQSLLGKFINTIYRDIKLRQLIKQKRIDVVYSFTGIGNRLTRYRYNSMKIISARDFGAMAEKSKLYYKALNNSSAMICNSEYIRQFFLSKYPDQSNKVFSVYNFIDVDEICKQAKEDIDAQCNEFIEKHTSIVVSVGRFCKEKGFEFLIESIALARKNNDGIGLMLVGDGKYKQKYLALIERFGLQEHVYFTGFQQNPYKYMARGTCFVLSSISEGFPNVLVEAMALGLPVIASNCYSGPAEILRNDADYAAIKDKYVECDYGIISPALKASDNRIAMNELSKAITRLLSNEELCCKYQELSIQRSLVFSEEATRKKLNQIFDILQDRRSAI